MNISTVLAALKGPGTSIRRATTLVPKKPGLYAVYGDSTVWRELGLGPPPDGRPLYVGKAEDSLIARDLETHFADGRTGSSTLRRSFAALLHDELGLRGIPRNTEKPGYFANYGLSAEHDQLLTTWMLKKLSIAVWAATGEGPLVVTEDAVLRELAPPLNLQRVVTQWSDSLRAKRAVMAAEARSWRPAR